MIVGDLLSHIPHELLNITIFWRPSNNQVYTVYSFTYDSNVTLLKDNDQFICQTEDKKNRKDIKHYPENNILSNTNPTTTRTPQQHGDKKAKQFVQFGR